MINRTIQLLVLIMIIGCLSGFGAKPEKVNTPITSISSIEIPLDVPMVIAQFETDIVEKESLYFYTVESYAKQGFLDKAIPMIQQIPNDLKIISKPLYLRAFSVFYQENGTEDFNGYLAKVDKSLHPYILENCLEYAILMKKSNDVLFFYPLLQETVIHSRVAEKVVAFYASEKQFDMATKVINTIEFSMQKDVARLTILKEKIKAGDVSTLESDIQAIVDDNNKNKARYEVIKLLAREGKFSDAYSSANNIKNKPLYENALTEIIGAYAKNKKYDSALQLAQTLTIEQYKEKALFKLGVGFGYGGNMEGLNQVFKKLGSDAIKKEYIKQVSVALAEGSYAEESFNLVSQLPGNDKNKVYIELSRHFGKQKDYHFALLLLQKIQDAQTQDICYAAFAKALAESKRINKAKNVIKLITDDALRDDVILTIFEEVEVESPTGLLEMLSIPGKFNRFTETAKQDGINIDQVRPIIEAVDDVLLHDHLTENEIAMAYIVKEKIGHQFTELKDKKVASELGRYIKKNKEVIDESVWRDYLKVLIQREKASQVLGIIKQIPDKRSQLYMFDLLVIETDPKLKKKQVKQLQSFAKAHKK